MPFLRLLVLVLITTLCVSSAAWGNADSTLTAAPLDTERDTKGKAGMRVGLIAGGIVGTAFFLLVGAAANSLCEGDCPDVTAAGFIGLGVLGATTGALSGALIGGLFGSMISDDKKVPEQSQATSLSIERRSIASLSVEPGVGFLTKRPENESGFMLRATLIAQLKPWLGVGPEVTYADLAGGTYGVRGAIYLGPRQTGLRPYVVTALGVQHWDTGTLDTDVEVLQLALGGGVGWTPGASNTHFGLEARYDFCAQNIDHSEAYTFVSTSAVLRRSW